MEEQKKKALLNNIQVKPGESPYLDNTFLGLFENEESTNNTKIVQQGT